MMAGAPDSKISALKSLSRPLGNLFQLQDDILGLFGSQEVIGKPVDSDIKEGKQTILIEQTLKRVSLNDQKFIQRSLGNMGISNHDFQKVREIVTDCGALDYSRRLIDQWVVESQRCLAPCGLSDEAKKTLIDFIDYLAVRKY
jgi:geranylgeranyl diphosphate synthase type I